MLSLLRLLILLVFLVYSNTLAGDVVINEILASNQSVNSDQDGDYEDWIELYNTGNTTIDLNNFGLSDTWDDPFRWEMPSVSLAPGEFMLIWASGKDRSDPEQELHTNFSISMEGEEVLLTDPDGTLVDSFDPIYIPADISYGRKPDGAQDLMFFTEPTPGSANNTQGYSTIIPAPELSVTSGFYSNPFYLEITSTEPDVTIYYTLDGSTPGPGNPVYSQPIEISSRQGEPNNISMIPTNNNNDPGPPYYEGWQPPLGEVFKVNVVRAVALREGDLPSPVVTATYLVDPQGSQRYSLPVFSFNTNPQNFFDPDIGIYVPGNHNNYFQSGPEWERKVHVEFFEPDGIPGFAQDVGVRIHGGTTRSRPRKSMRLYSRSDYGQSRINYQLFPDKPIAEFNRILLRNSGNDWDWAVFRDAFMQHLAKDLNVDIQYYRPVIVFLNGEYWGIHNMRDRYDEHYIETHYGINDNDMIMLENNAHYDTGNIQGRQHYLDMISYISSNSMANDLHYQEVTTRMDPWSFIDSQITNIFVMNTDWPGNNLVYWRHITDYNPEAPSGVDGRWRWMLLDLDFGFGLPFFYVPGVDEGPAHNTLAMAAHPDGSGWPNPPWSTLLLRRLLENNGFRNDFINRFADMLNTRFHQENVIGVIDSIQNILQPEMQEHIDRWRRPTSLDEWHDNLEVMRSFANQRPVYMRQHIREYFNLQDTAVVSLSVNDPSMGQLKINTIEVDAYPSWSGVYFRGVPVRVIARPAPGYRLASWEGVEAIPQDTLQIVLTGNVSVTAIFEPSGDFPGDEMNPPAHRVADGNYSFTYWSPNEPAGSFPPNMVFQQSEMDDPGLDDPMTQPYHIPYLDYHHDDMGDVGYPYRLTRRTRINALWSDGISFINTGRERDLGAAVLAIDTRETSTVYVSWTGGTLIPNSRAYAIRLQYRTGWQGPFTDLTDSQGNPVEYMRNENEGHYQVFQDIPLPGEAIGQPYVQLRWKYYYTGEQLDEESGARDMLRLDDIRVSSEFASNADPRWENNTTGRAFYNFPNPFSESTSVFFELDVPTRVLLTVHDQKGNTVSHILDRHLEAGNHTVPFYGHSLPSGIYFFRLQTEYHSQTKRMIIIR